MGGGITRGTRVGQRYVSSVAIEGTCSAIAVCPHGRYELRIMNGPDGETGLAHCSHPPPTPVCGGEAVLRLRPPPSRGTGQGPRPSGACRRERTTAILSAPRGCPLVRNPKKERIGSHFVCEIIYCVLNLRRIRIYGTCVMQKTNNRNIMRDRCR